MSKESKLMIDQYIEFESKRCFVRPFHDSDLDDFIEYRNNLDWMKYQGFKGLSKKEYAKKLLNKQNLNQGVQLAIINKINEQLIGDLFLKKERLTMWIGFTMNPTFKRKGFAYEVVRTLIMWIKNHGEYQVKASVLIDNIASINLLEKLGFERLKEKDAEYIYVLKES